MLISAFGGTLANPFLSQGPVYPSYTKIVHRNKLNKSPQSSVFPLRHYLMYKQQSLQKTLFVSLGSPNLVVDINCDVTYRAGNTLCFPWATADTSTYRAYQWNISEDFLSQYIYLCVNQYSLDMSLNV